MTTMVENFTPQQDQHLQIMQTLAYYSGVRVGLTQYSHWKNGKQYVGTNGVTLAEALKDVDRIESELLERYKKMREL